MDDLSAGWAQAVGSSWVHLFVIVGRAMDQGAYTPDDAKADVLDCAERAAGLAQRLVISFVDSLVPGPTVMRGPTDPTAVAVPLDPATPTDGLETDGFRILGRGSQPVILPNEITITHDTSTGPLVVTMRPTNLAADAPGVIFEGDLYRKTTNPPARILLATFRLPWFEQLAPPP